MMEVAGALAPIWTAVLVHPWQSTLVIIPLMLLGRLLARAPARQQEIFWSRAASAAAAVSATAATAEPDTEPIIESVPDTGPEVLVQTRPRYPEDARKAKATGTVVVKMLIDAEGDIVEAKILQGVPDFPGLDEAALEAARTCGFRPATKNGKPVTTWIALTYQFRLD